MYRVLQHAWRVKRFPVLATHVAPLSHSFGTPELNQNHADGTAGSVAGAVVMSLVSFRYSILITSQMNGPQRHTDRYGNAGPRPSMTLICGNRG